MSKREIIILDGRWLRANKYDIDVSYTEWPKLGSVKEWRLPHNEPSFAALSYVKSDGIARTIRIYTVELDTRKSGRRIAYISTEPTADGQPKVTVRIYYRVAGI